MITLKPKNQERRQGTSAHTLSVLAQRPWGVLVIMTGILFIGLEIVSRHVSGDVYWDLSTGRWQWLHSQVLRTNPFSWGPGATHAWVNNEWAWGYVVYGAARWFNAWGLLVVSGLGATAYVTGLGVFLRYREVQGVPWALGVLFGSAAVMPFYDFRPQVWAYPLAVWAFVLFEWIGHSESDVYHRFRWWIVLVSLVIFAGWVQIHGSWILMPVWAGMYGIWGRSSRRLMYWSLALLTAGIGIWGNPWGVAYVLKAGSTIGSTQIANGIAEWSSPNFHLVVLLVFTTIYLLFSWLAVSSHSWLSRVMWLGFSLAGLYAVRFMPYWGIGLGFALSGWKAQWRQSLKSRHINSALAIFVGVVSGVSLSLVVELGGHYANGNLRTGPFVSRSLEPVRATQWMIRHHDTTRVLNAYRAGGYFTYLGIRDWIDGRAGYWLLAGQRFQEYEKVRFGQISPLRLVHKVHPRVIIGENKNPLVWATAGHGGWQYGYHGQHWSVLVQKTGHQK